MTYKVNPNKERIHSAEALTASSNIGIYYRLIALWVLCEAMLGGIIHGFRIPVSGFIVGSCAVICISLIAWYHPVKGAILRATIIVAIFKMMLSPQAPFPAYFAVFFQGLSGELLFWRKRFYPISCILFSTLALLESGLQRIVILTLVYGNDLWKAINEFLNGFTGQQTRTNYSLIIGSVYVLLHALTGLLVGFWAGLLPHRLQNWRKRFPLQVQYTEPEKIKPVQKKKRRRALFIIWIILLLLYAQSEFHIGPQLLPSHISLKIFIRSLIIILSWYFLIGPLLKNLLHSWLQKKQQGLKEELRQILDLIPVTKTTIQKSWEFSKGEKGFSQILLFCKVILANSLSPSTGITILTGRTGSGKTTSLIKWSENKNDVHGILTPVIHGKRFFLNIKTHESWPMEAGETETEILQIGKYIFSKQGFEKAIAVLKDAKNKPGWLIIDELGPLELKGEGFYNITCEILNERNDQLLLIVRENLVNEMINKFDLVNPVIITDIKLIKNQEPNHKKPNKSKI